VDQPFAGRGQRTASTLNQSLITSKAILFLVPILRKETDDLKIINQITANTIGIAHLLITLTIAIGGGIIATLMKKRRRSAISHKLSIGQLPMPLSRSCAAKCSN
jgi:hypothetical protein